jgi:hypothetical protein
LENKIPDKIERLNDLLNHVERLNDVLLDLELLRALLEGDKVILSTVIYHRMDIFITGNTRGWQNTSPDPQRFL